MVNNFVNSNRMISIDGSFSGINYGSWIEREKRLNQNMVRLDNMKRLKNTGLQFNFLTYHINNNYAETLLNEIKEDYKTLSELNEIQEEHLSEFNKILNSELNESLVIHNPAADKTVYEYSIASVNYIHYTEMLNIENSVIKYIEQYSNRQISYEYYHNIFTNSHLHFTSLYQTGSISYNGIFQSYVPHIWEEIKVQNFSSISKINSVRSLKFKRSIMYESSHTPENLLYLEFDEDLAYYAVNNKREIDNETVYLIDFDTNGYYFDFTDTDLNPKYDGDKFVRYLPFYGSLMKNLSRSFYNLFSSKTRPSSQCIIHKVNSYDANGNTNEIREIVNNTNNIFLDSVVVSNLNCLKFSIDNDYINNINNINISYIESSFLYNGHEIFNLKWKPVPVNIKDILEIKLIYNGNEVVNNSINIDGNSKIHITTESKNNVHYKIAKINITEDEQKTNSLPKIFMTDKHSFDLYGIGDGQYNLDVTFVGEHGEYFISKYKVNINNENKAKNNFNYKVEEFDINTFSVKVRIKEETIGVKLPDSINVAISEKNNNNNVINSNFIKDVKYINCDMFGWENEDIPGYFASFIIYFNKKNLEKVTNPTANGNSIDDTDIINYLINKYFNIDIYCFNTKGHTEAYDIYNVCEKIINNNVSAISINDYEQIDTLNETDNEIYENSNLYEIEKINNLFSSALFNWRLFDNDKRLYKIEDVVIKNTKDIELNFNKFNENSIEMFTDISLIDIKDEYGIKYKDIEIEFKLPNSDYISITFDCELFDIVESGKYIARLLIYPNSIRLNGNLNNHYCNFYIDSALTGITINDQNCLIWNDENAHNVEYLTITATNSFSDLKFELDILTLSINKIVSNVKCTKDNNLYTLSTNKKYNLSYITSNSQDHYLYYLNVKKHDMLPTIIKTNDYLGSQLFGKCENKDLVWINLGRHITEISINNESHKINYYKWQQFDLNTGKFVDKTQENAFLLTRHSIYTPQILAEITDKKNEFYYSSFGDGKLSWKPESNQTIVFEKWKLSNNIVLPDNYILSNYRLWNLDYFDTLITHENAIYTYKPLKIFNNGLSNAFNVLDSFEIQITPELLNNNFDENDGSINIFDYVIISNNSNLHQLSILGDNDANYDNSNKKNVKLNNQKNVICNIYLKKNEVINLYFDDNQNVYEIELNDILRKISNIPIYHFDDKISNYPINSNYDNLLHKKGFYGYFELTNGNFINYKNLSSLVLVNNRFWGISCNGGTKYFAYSIPELSFDSTFKSPHLNYINEGNDIFNYFMLYSNISRLYKHFGWSNKNNNKNALFNSISLSKLKTSSINDLTTKIISNTSIPTFTKYVGIEQYVEEAGLDGNDIFNKTEIKKENVLDLYFKNKNEFNDFWIKRIEAYDELLSVLSYFDNYKGLTPLEFANELTKYLYPRYTNEAGFMSREHPLTTLRNRQLLNNKTRYNILTNNGKNNIYTNQKALNNWNNFLYSEIISKIIPQFHINENILSDIASYGFYNKVFIPSSENYGINKNGEIKVFETTQNKLNRKDKQYSYIYDNHKNIINIGYSYMGTVKKTFYAKQPEPNYYLSDKNSYLGLLYCPRYTVDNNGKIVPTSYLTYNKHTFTYTLNYSYFTVNSITNVINGITANNILNTDISYYVVSNDGSYITKRGEPLRKMEPLFSYNSTKSSYCAYTVDKNGKIIKYEFENEIPNSHMLQLKNDKFVFCKSFDSNEKIITCANNTENIYNYGLYDFSYSYEGSSYIYNVLKLNEVRDIKTGIKIQQNLCKYLINEVEKTSLMLRIFDKSKKLMNTFNNDKYVITGIELDRDYISTNIESLDIKFSMYDVNDNSEHNMNREIYLPKNTYFSWINNDVYAYTSKLLIDKPDLLNPNNTYKGKFWHDFRNGYTFKYLNRSLKFDDIILKNDTVDTLFKIHWNDVTKLSVVLTDSINELSYLHAVSTNGGHIKEFNLYDNKNYKFLTYTKTDENVINYTTYSLSEIQEFISSNGVGWNGYCFDINEYKNYCIYDNVYDSISSYYIYYDPTSYYTENKSLISLTYTYEFSFANNLVTFNIDLPPYPENEEKWKCDVEICYLGIPNNKLQENEPYIWITPHNKDFEPFGIWAYNIKDIDVEVQTNFANRNYLFDKDKYMYKFAYDFRYFQGPWAYTNTDIPNVRNYDNYETVKNHEYAFVSGLENTNYMLTSEHLYDPVAARVSSNYVSKINNYIFGENQPFEFYLGSINEWQLVSDNIQEISKKVLELNGDPLYDGQKKYNNPAYYLYWTSSEESTDCAWNIFLNECTFREQNKNSHLFVRPFFKIKNEIPTFTNVIFENVINASNIVKLNPDKRVTSPGSTPTTINEALGNFAKIKDKFYAINIIYDYDQFDVDKLLEGNFYPQPYSNVSLSDIFWKTEYEYIIDDINELTYISYKLPNSNTQYKCDINGLLSLYNKSAYEYFAKTHYDNVIPGCSLAYILNYINNNDKILYYNAKPYDSGNVGNINFFTELSDNIDNEMLNNKLLENKKLACLTILAISNQCKSSKFVRSFPSVGVFNNGYEQKFEITSYSFGTDNILTINPNVSSGIVDNSVVNWESNVWQVSTEGKTIHDSLKKYINFEPISLLVHNHKLNYINDGENSYSYLYNETIAITHSYLTYTCIIETKSLIKGPQYISGQSPLTPPIITPQ